jgi:transcriptional regulator with XRE-family HTH domain
MKERVYLQTFGKRLRSLRKIRGWSQEVLAEQAGLHPTYIGGIERGERNPSLINLVRLAKALSLSLAELVDIVI